jgi:hypothetical protein
MAIPHRAAAIGYPPRAVGARGRPEHTSQRDDRADGLIRHPRRALVPGRIQHRRSGQLSRAAGRPDGRLAPPVRRRATIPGRAAAEFRASSPRAPGESGWAKVREAQRQAVASDPHAGLAVTIDIGDPHNLHPTNKQDVGRRLARAARHVIYGESDCRHRGRRRSQPRATDGAISRRNSATSSANWSTYSHDSPIGFELCGGRGGQLAASPSHAWTARACMLSIPNAMSPTRVRYCWADSPVCTLFDRSGLPAGPFELRIRK